MAAYDRLHASACRNVPESDGVIVRTPTPASGHRARPRSNSTESIWPANVCVPSVSSSSQIPTVLSTNLTPASDHRARPQSNYFNRYRPRACACRCLSPRPEILTVPFSAGPRRQAGGTPDETVIEVIGRLWPLSVCVQAPVVTSQILMVLSSRPRRQPAAVIGRDRDRSSDGLPMVLGRLLVGACRNVQILMVRSSDPDTSQQPSGSGNCRSN